MRRLTWDETWLGVARVIARRSRCTRDQVGAVIVDADQVPLVASYNGPPPGFEPPTEYCRDWCPRAQLGKDGRPAALDHLYEDCPANHAEANALARTNWHDAHDATIYVTSGVCYQCAKLIAASGLHRVVLPTGRHEPAHRDPHKVHQALLDWGIQLDYVLPRS